VSRLGKKPGWRRQHEESTENLRKTRTESAEDRLSGEKREKKRQRKGLRACGNDVPFTLSVHPFHLRLYLHTGPPDVNSRVLVLVCGRQLRTIPDYIIEFIFLLFECSVADSFIAASALSALQARRP
jgi:hypothetical protein